MTIAQLIDNPFLAVLAILVLILGPARLTRIIYWDAFPLAIKFRAAWDKLTDDSPWNKLFHCPWCLNPWVTLVAIGWFMLGQIDGWAWVNVLWWVFWGWLAVAYIGTMVIVRDEPADD